MKPMFSIFTQTMKFDCLFLAIFQSFSWFVSFIFEKLALPPTEYASKDIINHIDIFVHSSAKQTVS